MKGWLNLGINLGNGLMFMFMLGVESAEATRQGLGQEQRKGSTSDRITTPK